MVLLIYHHTFGANAPTIMEHVNAFRQYSSFDVLLFNSEMGFPKGLPSCHFDVIVLHYSLFGAYPFHLSKEFITYISGAESLKVVFFQDEMQHCRERFRLIDALGIDVIYSLLDPCYFDEVYKNSTTVKDVRHTLTGYVSDDLVSLGKKYYMPFDERAVDVGYRARSLGYHYGHGAREKSEIADKFLSIADKRSLRLDISTADSDRIYGRAWYHFVANCRFMLGVMAGTSIFDLDGAVKEKVDGYLRKTPLASFHEVQTNVLLPYENKIRYRTISPRIFECIALGVCMILYRDDYQGVLIADKHYIALEKDFSNIESVFAKMNDHKLVAEISGRAYKDVIESENWHYKKFLKEFDRMLENYCCNNDYSKENAEYLRKQINKDKWFRGLIYALRSLRFRDFPGRSIVKKLVYSLGGRSGRN